MGRKLRGNQSDSGTEKPRKSTRASKKAQAPAVTMSPGAGAGVFDGATAVLMPAEPKAEPQVVANAEPKAQLKTAHRPRKPSKARQPESVAPVAPMVAVETPPLPPAPEPVDGGPNVTDLPAPLSAEETAADQRFADALSNAFIVHEPGVDDEPDIEGPAELPFIIDIPREVPVVDPSAQSTDEWVDIVLESPRKPAQLPQRPVTAARAAKPVAKPVAKAREKTSAKPAVPSAAAKPVARLATAPAANVTATRWWLVLPVFAILAVFLVFNRPGQGHAPVPAGVIGTWTTAFWLYEHQTLEIGRDTVVVTLDEPEEGRYAITKVETTDAGRETSVKISYRLDSGDEKVLDFLADKDPTTALRFRAHSGLVWTRAQD